MRAVMLAVGWMVAVEVMAAVRVVTEAAATREHTPLSHQHSIPYAAGTHRLRARGEVLCRSCRAHRPPLRS